MMKNGNLALVFAGIAVGAAMVGTIAMCVAVSETKKKNALEEAEFELLEDA